MSDKQPFGGGYAAPPPPSAPHRASNFLWLVRLLVWGGLAVAVITGGPLVSAVALSAFLAALVADYDGFGRHVIRIGSLPLAAWLTRFVEPQLLSALPPAFGNETAFGLTPAWCVSFALLVLGLNLLVTVWPRRRRARGWGYALNHLAGIGLGVTWGAAGVVALFWGLSAFESPLRLIDQTLQQTPIQRLSPIPHLAKLRGRLSEDPAAGWLERRNVLHHVPTVATVRELADLAQDPVAMQALARSPELRQLGELPDAQAVLARLEKHPHVQQALERRDVEALMLTPAAADLLDDPKLLSLAQEQLPAVRQALKQTSNARLKAWAEKLDADEIRRLQRVASRVVREVQRAGSANELKLALRNVR